METAARCDLCSRAIAPGAAYIVRIDVFADPEVPPITTEICHATDFDKTFADLLLEMEQTSAEELQDAVHRRLEFRLCGSCQRDFLVNPLGKPRRARAGRN